MALKATDIQALRELAHFEQTTPETEYPLGWSWRQVRIWPSALNRLVIEGLIEVTFSSGSFTGYKLSQEGKALARQAEPLFQPEEIEQGETIKLPEDMFAPIENYLDVKVLVLKVIGADKPVHLLFTGVPASAKTMFLMELARIRGAVYILGSQSTKAGIAQTLFDLKPRLLLVDEIDRVGTKDIAVLLSLAETGIVNETKYGKRREIKLETKIFAASNTLNMPKELISRFMVLTFKPYAKEEFIKVATSILVRREGTDENLAAYIAQRVWQLPQSFPDPRQTVRIARLAKTREEVDNVLSIVMKYSGLASAN